MTIAVVGASGFVGSAIVEHCRAAGVPVAGVSAPRILAASGRGTVPTSAARWRASRGRAFEALCLTLAPYDVVINAAGLARPDAPDDPVLFGANAVLPTVVAQAAASAGVRRLVHVSTAAVQGRMEPLDETSRLCPLSPYAVSKAEGERALLEGGADGSSGPPPEVVVYRPTSIHAAARAVTRELARTTRVLPMVPVAGRGDRPVPVALVENVAAGVLFAASMPAPPSIVLHPWEGLTTRRLLELFGARRIVALPSQPVEVALELLSRAAVGWPAVSARGRRLELVLQGQGVDAQALTAAGFRLPLGEEGWKELAWEAARPGIAERTTAWPAAWGA